MEWLMDSRRGYLRQGGLVVGWWIRDFLSQCHWAVGSWRGEGEQRRWEPERSWCSPCAGGGNGHGEVVGAQGCPGL